MSASRNRKPGGVLAMITLLALGGASICFNPFTPDGTQSEEEMTQVTIRRLKFALGRYREIAGTFPSEAQGLEAFVVRPTAEPVPAEWAQLFRALPRDGWGREFHYEFSKHGGFALPRVISAGEDGEFATADDIASRARKSGAPSTTSNDGSDNHENEQN